MAICMQDLDSAVLYALVRLRGEAKALKLEKKASMKHLSWVLASNKLCYEVITYVCSGKIIPCRQCSSSDKCRSQSYYSYTQAWSKLHNEVMS